MSFQRLIERIDALGDRLAPVVVLTCRREYRGMLRGWIWTTFCTLLAVAALAGCLFGEEAVRDMINLSKPTPGPKFFIGFLCYLLFFGLSMSSMMASMQVSQGWKNQKNLAPDYYLTPMGDREIARGFFQLWNFRCLSAGSLVLPVLAVFYQLRFLGVEWVFALPLSVWCLCVLMGNIVFAFSCINNPFLCRPAGCAFLGVGSMLLLCYGLPMSCVFTARFWGSFLMHHHEIFEPRFWLPGLVLATMASFRLTWRLIDYNSERSRPIGVKLRVTASLIPISLLLIGVPWAILRLLFR